MQTNNTALTLAQQAQTVALLTGTYTDRYDLAGIHNAYCNTGVLTDMLSDDDQARFDHDDIDTTADDFDIFGHGELSFTKMLESIKAIGEIETVIAYALPMHVELEKAGALYIQRNG
jgi:hypothetical protein